jgi:hypothetical protein
VAVKTCVSAGEDKTVSVLVAVEIGVFVEEKVIVAVKERVKVEV